MKKHKALYSVLLVSLLTVVSLFAFKPVTPPMNPPVVAATTIIPTPTFRGMYVNDFNTILGTSAKEDSVLNYITAHNLNALYFYDLSSILGTPSNFAKLDTLIAKAKRRGVMWFGGTRASYNRAVVATNSNVAYNTTARNKLNTFNLENEFWNYEVNNLAGNLPYLQWKIENSKIYTYCVSKSIIADMYMGHFKDPYNNTPATVIANQIAKQNHRVLISDYVTTTKFINKTEGNFSAIKERLQILGTEAQKRTGGYVDVIIIFHGGNDYMHSYFTNHTFVDAYNSVVATFNKSSFTGKKAIRIKGYMIYGYQQVKTL